ncbi:T-SNARE affecting a late Golgi compartment protein 2 [Scheffersomyces coipomensis]|uniref:T-SNARE affecting a late Golgi compartment protein 2 n=1 Tax=Scheffersomyces coipomensis TaxID=1788519 RepID=UPI00315CBC40
MFRDRTNLFLSYRRTIPRSNPIGNLRGDNSGQTRFDNLDEEEEGLIGNNHNSQRRRGQTEGGRTNDIEMKPIIPTIYDIAGDLDDKLKLIKNQVNDLNSNYKRLIIINKSEKNRIEKRIDDLNYEILKNFESCYIMIKKFEYLNLNYKKLGLNFNESDLEILNNFKKNYAIKIQESSIIFRNLQNNYIKFLRDDDDEDEFDQLLKKDQNDSTSSHIISTNTTILQEEQDQEIENYSRQVLQQQQQHAPNANSAFLQQREREISKLAMGIIEISTIFKEMESMIVEQGTILDRIDYNLQNAAVDLKDSDRELIKAKHYQKRTTKCKIIFLMCLIVFVLVIVVLVKPHGTTTVIEKPVSSPPPPKTPDVPADDRPAVNPPEDDFVDDGDVNNEFQKMGLI